MFKFENKWEFIAALIGGIITSIGFLFIVSPEDRYMLYPFIAIFLLGIIITLIFWRKMK